MCFIIFEQFYTFKRVVNVLKSQYVLVSSQIFDQNDAFLEKRCICKNNAEFNNIIHFNTRYNV